MKGAELIQRVGDVVISFALVWVVFGIVAVWVSLVRADRRARERIREDE